jgi:hypothetical protein
LHPEDNITSGEGRGNAFIMFLKKGRNEEIAVMLTTPERIQELQTKLCRKAKQDREFRWAQAAKAAGRR